MNPELGSDYELLAAVANVAQVVAWIAILVGAFLRERNTRNPQQGRRRPDGSP